MNYMPIDPMAETPQKTERHIYLAAMTVLGCFIAVTLLQKILNIRVPLENYLGIHMVLEFFSIAVSFAIAIQCWMIFPHTVSRHRLLVGAVFFAVGLLDLIHTLTYKGMPAFVGESSIAKATWFWISARLTESFFVFLVFALKDRPIATEMRRVIFFGVCAYLMAVIVTIFTAANLLPVLVVEGNGTTPLKNMLEYLVSLLHLTTVGILFRRYRQSKRLPNLILSLAMLILLISELIFTLYQSVYDLNNIMGHVFKAIGYFYLMKGLYIATIEEPYIGQKLAEEAASRHRKQLEIITSSVGEGLYVLDVRGCVTFSNPEAERLTGWKANEILGKNIHEVLHYQKEDGSVNHFEDCPIYDTIQSGNPIRVDDDVFITKQKVMIPVSYVATPIWENGRVTGAVVAFSDITERKCYEEQIKYQAYYDSLTGLPNRHQLHEYLKNELAVAKQEQSVLAVMFLDLDRFKNVNDYFGHAVGDMLLQEVARRLRQCLDAKASVFRLGGDEFAVILRKVEHINQITQPAAQIIELFTTPFTLEGREIFVTTSIGISLYPLNGENEVALVQSADMAMYYAKEMGKNNYQFYTVDMTQKVIDQLEMENQLHQALDRNELIVYYQPQINISNGEIAGMEALIRWNQPERGLVPPGEFIPLAEETGLIVPIGKWVLKTACAQNMAWQRMGLPPQRVSVNLSLRQFQQPDLVEMIAEVLRETGLDPDYLELEITETIAMYNESYVISKLNKIRNLGIHIAIDDFGTGYSSLSYLRKFPIDTLKIDRSFVNDISTDNGAMAIARSTISLAQSLQLNVVAEGVETEEQLRFLSEQKCNLAQGYLFSKPLPADEFEKLLLNRQDKPLFSRAK